ncbi:MAG: hypothetical protein JST66_05630 [Bacteroidetes bacterium]|nr:hypothetical protein [Bacteroidota bacterium]
MHVLRPLTILASLIAAAPLAAQEEQPADSAAIMNAIMGLFNSDAVKVEPTYAFQHRIAYDLEKTDPFGEHANEPFTFYFSTTSPVIGMYQEYKNEERPGELFLVFDPATRGTASFVHADTLKVCIRMTMPTFGDRSAAAVFKPTDREREIAGLKAREWMSTSEEEEVHLWIAESRVGDVQGAFHAFGKVHGKPALGTGAFGNGLVLAGSFIRAGEGAPYYAFDAREVQLDAPFVFRSEGYRMGM